MHITKRLSTKKYARGETLIEAMVALLLLSYLLLYSAWQIKQCVNAIKMLEQRNTELDARLLI